MAKTILVVRAAAGELPLALPESATVLDLRVDGQRLRWPIDQAGRPVLVFGAAPRPREVVICWAGAPIDLAQERIELPHWAPGDHPRLYSVAAMENWHIETDQTPATTLSMVEVQQAGVWADELDRLLGAARSVDSSSGAIWDVERAFLAAVGAARRTLEIEAEQSADPALAPEHERAAQALAALVERNRRTLESAGLASVLGRADAQAQRQPAPSSLPRLEPGDRSAPTATFSLPAPGSTRHFATTGDASIQLAPRSGEAVRTTLRTWLFPILGGLAGSIVSLLIARRHSARLLIVIALIAAGLFWAWKLQPEPVGPALMLIALVISVVHSALKWRHEIARA